MSINAVRNKLIKSILSSKNGHYSHHIVIRSSSGLQKMCYNLSKFNQYGLMRDDVRDTENPDVAEALRRLPEDIKILRDYRILRAMQLSITRVVLPQKEWMTLENDELYLTPYIEEVIKEREEQEEWNKLY